MSDIDYIKKIDFSKGFQRFHVKWPLKDLTKPKESSIFETTVTDGGRKITLRWSLAINDLSEDSTYSWFGASLKSPGKITPMIYRICLSSSTNVLFDESYFGVIDGTDYHGHKIPSSEFDAYPIDDLMLQLWIDLPKAILIGSNSDKNTESGMNGSSQKKTADAFLLDKIFMNIPKSKIFSRVTGTEAGDSSSNISIFIVNNEDEEITRHFRCHTDVLSARSTFFERMFASDEWKEKCARHDRVVKIDDIDAHVMEIVLQYMYTSTFPNPSADEDDLFDIFFAANKYDLTELKNWCGTALIFKEEFLDCRINQLIFADRHNLQQLKSVCLAQLSMTFHTAFSDPDIVDDFLSNRNLWSEIMKAISDGQATMTEIEVEEDDDEDRSDFMEEEEDEESDYKEADL